MVHKELVPDSVKQALAAELKASTKMRGTSNRSDDADARSVAVTRPPVRARPQLSIPGRSIFLLVRWQPWSAHALFRFLFIRLLVGLLSVSGTDNRYILMLILPLYSRLDSGNTLSYELALDFTSTKILLQRPGPTGLCDASKEKKSVGVISTSK